MDKLFWLFADVSKLLHYVLTDTASTGTPETPSGKTGGELHYPLPYSAEEYFRLTVPRLDARQLVITLSGGRSRCVQATKKEIRALSAGFKCWSARKRGGIRQTRRMHRLWAFILCGLSLKLNKKCSFTRCWRSYMQTGLFWRVLPSSYGVLRPSWKESGLSIAFHIESKKITSWFRSVSIKNISVGSS